MIYRACLIVFLACICALPCAAQAQVATFTASTEVQEVSEGEAFSLVLVLSDAQAEESPSLSGIDAYFDVSGVRHNTRVSIINGAMQNQYQWNYTLTPKRTGNLTIPGISLRTDRGVLRSQPIHIKVVKGTAPSAGLPGQQPYKNRNTAQADLPDISLKADVNKTNPYVGEAILMRVTVHRGDNVLEAEFSTPTAPSARIEAIETTQMNHVYQGNKRWLRNILPFVFIPLKDGAITIEKAALKGSMFSSGPPQPQRLDPTDPFAMMEQMLRGGGRTVKEFIRYTPELPLTVRPIPNAWKAPREEWLPVQSLQLSEKLQQPTLAAGEPITRTITMKVIGAYAESLPSLEAIQRRALDEDNWLLYASKPESKTVYSEQYQTIITTLTQSLTYVPQHGGTLTFPALSVAWWDVRNDRLQTTQLEGKPLSIAGDAAPHNTQKHSTAKTSPHTADADAPASTAATPTDKSPFAFSSAWMWWLVIAIVSTAFIWLAYRLLYGGSPTAPTANNADISAKKSNARSAIPKRKLSPRAQQNAAIEKARLALEQASTPKALSTASERYTRLLIQCKPSTALAARLPNLVRALDAADAADLTTQLQQLEKAAYGGGKIADMERFRTQWISLLTKAEKALQHSDKNAAPQHDALPPLNP